MSAEQEEEEIRRVKESEQLIEKRVLSVGPETSVAEVERLMAEHGIGGVPVVEGDKIVGIVSRRDIRAMPCGGGARAYRRS